MIACIMDSGTIVEYIDRQKIICAVVLQDKGKRLRLLTQYNREVKLSPGRVTHACSERLDPAAGRERLVDLLNQKVHRRQQLKVEIDVPALWEQLNNRRDWIDLDAMVGFCFPGSAGEDHRSAVIRALFDHRLYFKFAHDRFLPQSPEKVARAITAARRQAEKKEIVEEGGKWLREIGQQGGRDTERSSRQESVLAILKDYLIKGKESSHYALARAMLLKAGLLSDHDVVNLLVRLGIWQEHENIDLHRQRLSPAFPAETQAHAAALCDSRKTGGFPGRRDLTHLFTLTIDGQSTLDFDDALSIEEDGGYLHLGIHVADVAHYVRRGDPVDREALARGSSIYMPDAKIPMLPPFLAEDLCSLKADQVRPAISVLVTLDNTGAYVRDEIVPSVIRVNEQMTYYEANLAFEDQPALKILAEIASSFRKSRLDAGAVQITLPEIHVWVGDDHAIRINRINRESPGRMLVSEIMILANRLMAKHLAERGLPTVYRSQAGPRDRLYKGMEGTLFQNWMQRKLLNRFVLGTSPERHSGLGLDAYTTGTSPIRKYYDLITQRQVRSRFRPGSPLFHRGEIHQLIARLDPVVRRVAKIQNDRHRYWVLFHLESRYRIQGGGAGAVAGFGTSYKVLLTRYMLEMRPAGRQPV
jgi:exoribonuclease-2